MWNQSDSNDSKKMNFSVSSAAEIEGNLSEPPLSESGKIDKKFNSSGVQCYSSGVDSGFLSGPQLESCEIFCDDEDDDDDNNVKKESKIEVTNTSNTTSVTVAPVAAAATTAAAINITADNKSAYDTGFIDSGCIEEDKSNQSEKMILDNEIDSGLTEWFCNLSLRTNQPINNLGSTQTQQTSKDVKKSAKDTEICSTTNKTNWQSFYTQDNDGVTQFHLACLSGYLNVIAALIRMAPHPCLLDIENDEAQSALHIATLTAQPQVIRMLLIAGAEPTLRDRNGNTALHLACISGELECVKALTIPISVTEIQEAQRLKIIISTTNFTKNNNSTDRTTSTSQQQQQQHFQCAQLPTDLEIRNYDGERCVHLAAQGNHIEVLRHLIWLGADINAREGKSGRTPLHIAIEQCNEILTNFLIEECQQKINLETVTFSGLTPYQFACILQNHKLQNDLRKFGAEPLTPPDSDTDGSDMESELDDSQIYDNYNDQGYIITSFNGIHAINVA